MFQIISSLVVPASAAIYVGNPTLQGPAPSALDSITVDMVGMEVELCGGGGEWVPINAELELMDTPKLSESCATVLESVAGPVRLSGWNSSGQWVELWGTWIGLQAPEPEQPEIWRPIIVID